MKTFKKYYKMPALPDEVYLALTSKLAVELWTGEPAVMSGEVGSEFSLWSGSIVGKNLEFEENNKIVQQWYFGDQEEISLVTIKLHADKKGTSVELVHTNIPDVDYDDIVDGWTNTYFAYLLDFFHE